MFTSRCFAASKIALSFRKLGDDTLGPKSRASIVKLETLRFLKKAFHFAYLPLSGNRNKRYIARGPLTITLRSFLDGFMSQNRIVSALPRSATGLDTKWRNWVKPGPCWAFPGLPDLIHRALPSTPGKFIAGSYTPLRAQRKESAPKLSVPIPILIRPRPKKELI